jgi:hypothetical protein
MGPGPIGVEAQQNHSEEVMLYVTVSTGNYQGHGVRYELAWEKAIARQMGLGARTKIIRDADLIRCGIPVTNSWWDKMALFHPDMFDQEEEVFFTDLDTVTTGPLHFLEAVPFDCLGMISDFYHPQFYDSAVMTFSSGGEMADRIWSAYVAAGMPTMGPDGRFLDALFHDEIFDLRGNFPLVIQSFKQSIGKGVMPGEECSVVCFHGLPRPHMVADLMKEW